jgi:hypothetical protein
MFIGVVFFGSHYHPNTVHHFEARPDGMAGGIYFRLIEDVRRPDSWWTFRINLWYPIILFGILPAIFAVKKLRGGKPASTNKTTVEK